MLPNALPSSAHSNLPPSDAVNLFATQALDTSNHASRSFGLSLNLPLDFRRQQQASFDLRHENGHYSERAFHQRW
ncbi:hypothetical protein KMZ27_16240 [Pseudomonas shirazica]|nr:hypothetical protein [Pseudomonas shirazica]